MYSVQCAVCSVHRASCSILDVRIGTFLQHKYTLIPTRSILVRIDIYDLLVYVIVINDNETITST